MKRALSLVTTADKIPAVSTETFKPVNHIRYVVQFEYQLTVLISTD
jgi:hypothetical protein